MFRAADGATSTPTTTRPSRSSTRARTARGCRCSSSHKKGLKLDGSNPTLLYGYGGFNISLTPGVLAPHARSGWRWAASTPSPTCAAAASTARTGTRPARKRKKQNVFDDFIAAAEWLIANKYTSHAEARHPRRQSTAACWSARCMTQRPGSVRRGAAGGRRDGHAALPQVHRSAGPGSRDYGSPDDAERVQGAATPTRRCTTSSRARTTRRRSSPPPTTTTASCRRTASSSPPRCRPRRPATTPILIRIETRAGHGAGKPTAKLIDEAADRLAFLVKALGMTVPSDSSAAAVK